MKVAVVGSGIGGISAAYHLAKDGHQVTLLEANDEIGGHAYSIQLDGETVDLGFMMFGDSNPNIKKWFKSLGLTKEDGTTGQRIPMSMSVSSDLYGDIQFSSRRPFPSLFSLTDIQIWKIIIDIYKFTQDLLVMPTKDSITTKEWAKQGRYSHEFFRHYFLPFVAILWTIPKRDVMDLPVTQFLRCLKTHAHSLYMPIWQVFLGIFGKRYASPKHLWWFMGSKYRPAFITWFQKHNGVVQCSSKVTQVAKGGKTVTLENGVELQVDHVVLACHPDQCIEILPNCTAVQELGKYKFHKSMIYVHRDPSFLPPEKKSWASWNVRITQDDEYILTYWMNRIQKLKTSKDVFVTITPFDFAGHTPKKELLLQSFPWNHPRLLADCIPQNEIIQEDGITLSGAWLGRGFHEDGFVAGRRAAAIVKDPKNANVVLYEDEGNVPIPAVPEYKLPLMLQVSINCVIATTVAAAACFFYFIAVQH